MRRMDAPRDAAITGNLGRGNTGGDAVCWLDRVCPECGALNEGSPLDPCWRCGTSMLPGERRDEQETGGGT